MIWVGVVGWREERVSKKGFAMDGFCVSSLLKLGDEHRGCILLFFVFVNILEFFSTLCS